MVGGLGFLEVSIWRSFHTKQIACHQARSNHNSCVVLIAWKADT